MKIRKVNILNFRGLKNISLEDLGDIAIFIGKSGNGKTSLLECLNLIFQNFDGQLQKNIAKLDDRYWYLRNTKQNIQVSIIFQLSSIELSRLPEKYKSLLLKNNLLPLDFIIEYGGQNNSILRINNNFSNSKNSEGIKIENDKDYSTLAKEIKTGFHWIKGCRLIKPNTLAVLDREPYIPSEIQNQIVNLLNSDKPEDEKNLASLLDSIDQVITIGSRLVVSNNKLQMLEDNTKYPVTITGSGQQSYLYLIHEIIKHPEDIIAIEDPGIHMHPSMATSLLNFMRKLNNQFFIVTHSTIFLDLINIRNNFIFEKENQETIIRKASNKDELIKFLEPLLGDSRELLLGKNILIVEGETEGIVIPQWIKILGGDINSPKLRIVNMEGIHDKKTIKTWVNAIKNTRSEIFLLLDSDNGYKNTEQEALKMGVRESNIHIINGTIEDLYPTEIIEKVLKEYFRVDWKDRKGEQIAKIDPNKKRIQEIKRILKESIGIKESDERWKKALGVYVSYEMKFDHFKQSIEMRNIRKFLNSIINA